MEREVATVHEPLAAYALGFLDPGSHRRARAAAEVGADEALLDVELARLAGLGVHAVPVVEAVGDVARLLDLEEKDVRADGVDGAGLEEDAVAGLGRVAVECSRRG